MDTSTTPVPADPTDPGPRPTCELEPTCTEHVSGDVFIYECSACGKSCDRVYGEDYLYCPYCGARAGGGGRE